jgi:ABC-type phosphate transport system substrate-binding protein
MKRLVISLLVIIIFLPAVFTIAKNKKGYKVVTGTSTNINSIGKDELSRIFLKKKHKWEDGIRIFPVDLVESRKERTEFSKDIHNKKVSSIKAYWQKQIFTGRGVPPPEKVSDSEVLDYIQQHEGAIGYISNSTSIENLKIKVITVTDD